MKQCSFYFDIISPYAYFAFKQLDSLPASLRVELKPVLFAGLLGHWGSKGPAEIPPKRIFTYQFAQWYANHHNIKFRCPPAHPFNPLPGLRLAIAAGCTADAIDKIFSFVWGDGLDFGDEHAWQQLISAVSQNGEPKSLDSVEVKQALRDNTDTAIAEGVFGVPSYVIDEKVFWGVDALPMVLDFLADPTLLDSDEMTRAANLPIGVARKLK